MERIQEIVNTSIKGFNDAMFEFLKIKINMFNEQRFKMIKELVKRDEPEEIEAMMKDIIDSFQKNNESFLKQVDQQIEQLWKKDITIFTSDILLGDQYNFEDEDITNYESYNQKRKEKEKNGLIEPMSNLNKLYKEIDNIYNLNPYLKVIRKGKIRYSELLLSTKTLDPKAIKNKQESSSNQIINRSVLYDNNYNNIFSKIF